MAEAGSTEVEQASRLVVDARPFARAGALLAETIASMFLEGERVRLAIPGGSALEAVAEARSRLGAGWRRIVLTWVDERCVPIADEASNRGAAMRLGLLTRDGHGPADVLPLFEDGEGPDAAVRRFESKWAEELDGALDVVLLGMGPDGHVASLFPSYATSWEGIAAHVADSPKPPADRITLTRSALQTARRVILVAAGEEKRPAVERLLAGDPALPAQGLRGLVVVTDLTGLPGDTGGVPHEGRQSE